MSANCSERTGSTDALTEDRQMGPVNVLGPFLVVLGLPEMPAFHGEASLVKGSTVRKGSGRKCAIGTRIPMAIAQGPNQRCRFDFVTDALWNGLRFRILCTIGDFSPREDHRMEGGLQSGNTPLIPGNLTPQEFAVKSRLETRAA